jgi:thymidylate kinase
MAGTTIVVDRYVYSGVAFTAAKVGYWISER